MNVERMTDFFESRIDIYEAHMLNEIEGLPDCYRALADALPEKCICIADLGAGTGLELAPILARFPELCVNAIDLSGPMLARLVERYEGRHICPIVGDLRTVRLGNPILDAVVSVEAMHHINEGDRRAHYPRVIQSLRRDGVYLECDYIAADDAEEARMLTEAAAKRREAGFADDVPLHLDTPMTAEHVMALLREVGFVDVSVIKQVGATALICARKP